VQLHSEEASLQNTSQLETAQEMYETAELNEHTECLVEAVENLETAKEDQSKSDSLHIFDVTEKEADHTEIHRDNISTGKKVEPLFSSTIHMESRKAGYSVDIKVNNCGGKSSNDHHKSSESGRGNPEDTTTSIHMDRASVRVRRKTQSKSRNHSTPGASHSETTEIQNQVFQLGLGFLDFIFWMCVGFGLMVYELIKKEIEENFLNIQREDTEPEDASE